MRLTRQSIMRLAVALALGAATGAALAHSAEYRRGYDDGYGDGYGDGYAAGLRAARGHGDRIPGGERLRILDAAYGARGSACDARQALRDALAPDGGAVRVDNALCGDPAVGVPKRLTVVYRCGRDEPVRVSVRENDTLRLSCRR